MEIDTKNDYKEKNWAQLYNEKNSLDSFEENIEEIGVDIHYNKLDEKKLSSQLLFFVSELGGIKRVDDKDVYIVTESAEKALKDLNRKLKQENPNYPLVRYYLGKWGVFRDNLIPIIHTQSENKSIIYQVLIILVFLTEPLEEDELDLFKYKEELFENFMGYKQLFGDSKFVNFLVMELSHCVKTEFSLRTKYENNIIELILYLIRNSLAFSKKNRNEQLFISILKVFSQECGVFDAIVYLTQEFNPSTKKYCFIFLEIISLIIDKIYIKKVFGELNDAELFRKMKNISKLKEIERKRNLHSTRHSKFGAMFEIRKNYKIVGFVSDPKMLNKDISMCTNRHIKNKIQKPKTRSKIPGSNTDIKTDFKVDLDTSLKNKIKIFFIDFLEHSFDSLAQTNYEEFYSQDKISYKLDESKIFFDFLSFGLDVCLLIKNSKKECNWFLCGLQINFIDFVFNKLVEAIAGQKSSYNFLFIGSCLKYLLSILESIKFLHLKNSEVEKENSQILQTVIFSKDFCRTIKKCFILFKKVPRNPVNITLIKLNDLFFQMLNNYSKNKIFSVTQKTEQIDEIPDYEEENLQMEKKLKIRERRFTYLTELGIFLDFDIINVHIEYLKQSSFPLKSKNFKISILNFIRRIIEDLNAKWMFYQMDYLDIFSQFYFNKDPFFKKDEICEAIRELISYIFKGVREVCEINSLFPVEMLFRFNSFSVKENILTNYTGIKQIGKEDDEIIDLEFNEDDYDFESENDNKENKKTNKKIITEKITNEKKIDNDNKNDLEIIEVKKDNKNITEIIDEDNKNKIEEEKKENDDEEEIIVFKKKKNRLTKIKDYQNLVFEDEEKDKKISSKNSKKRLRLKRRLMNNRMRHKEEKKKYLENSNLGNLKMKKSKKKNLKEEKKKEEGDEILVNDFIELSDNDSLSLIILEDEIINGDEVKNEKKEKVSNA